MYEEPSSPGSPGEDHGYGIAAGRSDRNDLSLLFYVVSTEDISELLH